MSLHPAPPEPDVLDALDAGMVVLDAERRIVRWNAWMVRTSGHTAQTALGCTLEAVFGEVDLSPLRLLIDATLENGVSGLLTHSLHPQLLPLKTRAGRELLHDVAVTAVRDGTRRGCLVHVSDVTMAVRRERFLRERQRARYDAVVANAPDVIITLDRTGIIRLINRATMAQFGYAPDELIGKSPALLFDQVSAWDDVWRRFRDNDTSGGVIDLEVRRRDGTIAYFEMSASQWLSESHGLITAILRNISERRAAAIALAELNATLEQRVQERTRQLLDVQETLRQSQKMEAIGQLTGGIAHDFNNLLQGITGSLRLIQKRIADGRISDLDRFLSGALTSANRASALTHRLLAFSRRQPIDPRPIDVRQLVGSIEELLSRSTGESIRLAFDHVPASWLIRCDVNQLENAFLNLAINARDAMPDGGNLTIRTRNVRLDGSDATIRDVKPGDYVRIEVCDSGVGMPADVQARAFDPFFTTKPIGKGTGLGLSMIYGFMRQSSGSARIISAPGNGTCVELCFPRFEGETDESHAADDEVSSPVLGSNEVVLVVEDDDVVRVLVVEVLVDLGYRALEARDGPSALRILQSSQRIDLLVTDIGLPDMNGRQLADAGASLRPRLKTLFMTGYAESVASDQFLDDRMELIVKPFDLDELAAKIRDMIGA